MFSRLYTRINASPLYSSGRINTSPLYSSRRINPSRRHSSSSPPRCPSCSQPFPSHIPVCTSCSSIHPLPPNISHHDLLHIPYQPNPFLVDQTTLKNHFRTAQASCHPDAWASKSPKHLDLAHTLSSKLNEAYQTLSNPLKRAEYILERNGLPLSETDHVDDMDFMASVMESREIIDDATQDDIQQIQELQAENEQHIAQNIDELASLISKEQWVEAKSAAVRLRYLIGIQKAIKLWMDHHE